MVEMKRRARFWKVSRSDGRFGSDVVTVGHFALASPARPGLEVTGSFFFRAGTFALGSLDPVALSCFFCRGSRLLCLKNSSLCPPFGLAAVCISRVLRHLLNLRLRHNLLATGSLVLARGFARGSECS